MNEMPFARPSNAGLHSFDPNQAEAVENNARNHALPVMIARLGDCGSIPQALRHLGKALAFPDWYGGNLDALYDCLCDPDWHPGIGQVVMLLETAHLRLSDPKGFASLSDVLAAAAEARLEVGQPLWLLIDSPAPGIPPLSGA